MTVHPKVGRRPVIAFATGPWTNVDDQIRLGRAPGGTPGAYKIWERCLQRGFEVHVFVGTDVGMDCPATTVALGGVKFHWVKQLLPKCQAALNRMRIKGMYSPLYLLGQMAMAHSLWRSGVRADFYYCQRHSYLVLLWILSRLTRAKLILRSYGTFLYGQWFEQKRWWPRLLAAGALLALKVPVDLHIMTNDGTSGDKIARWVGVDERKFRFWLNGVNKSLRMDDFDGAAFRSRLGLPVECSILVQVGRLDGWKRQDRIIDALPIVLKEFRSVKYCIIGKGPMRESLEARARQMGVSSSVIFVGAVDHGQIRDFLNAADLYVQAHDISNVSNTLIEAIAAGCCIVTTDVGTTSELVTDQHNAIVLKDGSTDNIAQAIIRLLANPDERSRLREAAHQYARAHFQSWEERLDMEIDEILSMKDTARRV